jgi:hypothetical protein
MKSIDVKFRYWGDMIKASILQEEDNRGVVYPIQLNGDYFFTLRYTEKNEWTIVRERNGLIPHIIDKELVNRIIKSLENELKFAA